MHVVKRSDLSDDVDTDRASRTRIVHCSATAQSYLNNALSTACLHSQQHLCLELVIDSSLSMWRAWNTTVGLMTALSLALSP
jgi:hypothetical protein